MAPNTLAPVPDVWRVAMMAGAGAVPLCAVWVEGGVDACGTTRRWRSVYGAVVCAGVTRLLMRSWWQSAAAQC
jgi:hypothetical protein